MSTHYNFKDLIIMFNKFMAYVNDYNNNNNNYLNMKV